MTVTFVLFVKVERARENPRKKCGGKCIENVATDSSICSKDSLSLSVKFFVLLSANSAFVYFIVPGFDFFSLSKDFSVFLTRFTTSMRSIKRKEER